MALAKRKQENLRERKEPGEPGPIPCAPGSIEQQLDMCEDGTLRGDSIDRSHGRTPEQEEYDGEEEDIQTNFNVDMSEDDREGDEMSGDDHSAGLQGGDSRESEPSGLPGSGLEKEPLTIKRRPA